MAVSGHPAVLGLPAVLELGGFAPSDGLGASGVSWLGSFWDIPRSWRIRRFWDGAVSDQTAFWTFRSSWSPEGFFGRKHSDTYNMYHASLVQSSPTGRPGSPNLSWPFNFKPFLSPSQAVLESFSSPEGLLTAFVRPSQPLL